MAKKTEIKFDAELSYILEPFGKRDSNACDSSDRNEFDRYQKALKDDTKKHLTPYVRANFSVVINTNKKTIGQIQEEIDELRIERFIELCNDYITIIKDNSTPVFPDLKVEEPVLVEWDWKKKFVVNKNKLIYRTNLYFHLNCDAIDPEPKLLDVLQQMIKEGYEKYINLTMHFNCWAYHIGNRPYHEFTPQELINHRRK